MNENFKSMISTFVVFNILPHFSSFLFYNALNARLSKTSSVYFCVTAKTVTHKNGAQLLIFWVTFLSSASGVIAWANKQNQQRWTDKQIWIVESDDDVIFTFSVIYQFSRGRTPCSGFPTLSVSKRKIRQYFTNYTTLERTTQAYIANVIIANEVAVLLFVISLIGWQKADASLLQWLS